MPDASREPVQLIQTANGYVLAAQGESEAGLVTLTAPDGRLCLKLWLLPEGPIVEVQGQALHLRADRELRLDCERLVVNAARETSINTGALTQRVLGNVELQAGGTIRSEGHAQDLRARRGDLSLSANDDVCVDGERILLNSPKPPRLPGS